VDSEKAIAPRCRVSRSRGGRGQETHNRSLFFGRGRHSSINDRQGDTTKEHQQADLLASSIVRTSRCPAREADGNAHIYVGHGVRTRGRIEGERQIRSGRLRQRRIRRKGQRIEPRRPQQHGSGQESRVSNESNEGDEEVGGGAGLAGQGPASVLAGGFDDGDERSSVNLPCWVLERAGGGGRRGGAAGGHEPGLWRRLARAWLAAAGHLWMHTRRAHVDGGGERAVSVRAQVPLPMGRRPCLGATDDAVGGALAALVRATVRETAREVAGAGCSRLGRWSEEGGRPTTNDWDAGGGARQGLALGSDGEGQRSGTAAQEDGAQASSGVDPRVAGVAPAGSVRASAGTTWSGPRRPWHGCSQPRLGREAAWPGTEGRGRAQPAERELGLHLVPK
jgi:hypothetical protein